jgi:RNA polymerase sigma factor (sigma-70 family)
VDFIERIRQQPADERRWADWYTFIYPKVYCVALRLCQGNRDRSRDLTQETFARFVAYHCIHRVHNDHDALAYLLRICQNRAASWFGRHAGLREELRAGFDELQAEPNRDDELIDLESLARRLKADEKRLFELILSGATLRDIAATLEITYTAAGVRFFRLKKHLQDLARSGGKFRP